MNDSISKCIIVLVSLILFFQKSSSATKTRPFATVNGTRFLVNGNPLYLHGFNAYWLMYLASDPTMRDKVSTVLERAAKNGMNVARTFAFSDGSGDKTLQVSPGIYNEDVLKGLDFVVSEAAKKGVYLVLSLVNNWPRGGGKQQYVQWATDRGQNLTNDDDFFTNMVVREYYKNHVKVMLTRVNSITGVAYKDDPTIFAWELMNEPRCMSNPSGEWVQTWVEDMAPFVKSIDSNHLLAIGLEGFYGTSKPGRVYDNPLPGWLSGTDFISNNQVPAIDYLTVHLYPEKWLPSKGEPPEAEQAVFVKKWIKFHLQDSAKTLNKPMVINEFGKNSTTPGFKVEQRDYHFKQIYDTVYRSARNGGPCVGSIFWQLLAPDMSSYGDGYQVVLEESPSTANVINKQFGRLSSLQLKNNSHY